MRTLILLLALVATGPLISSAHAGNIEKTGVTEVDKIFREVGGIDGLLDAADARMDTLLADVSSNLGIGKGASMTYIVYSIKEQANGDIRIINADGRPVLALGADAPKKAKDAASTLNEGTQELAVMAADIGRLPARLKELTEKSGSISITSAVLDDAGVDSGVSEVKDQITSNIESTKGTKSRAAKVSNRAVNLLDEVRDGMSATSKPKGPSTDTAAPKPASKPSPKPSAKPKPKPTGPTVMSIQEVTDKAWTFYTDGDLDKASSLLAKADGLLPKQSEPVSRQALIDLFQMRSLVNLDQGDATASAWAATQSLVIHPNASPEAKMGGGYAKLHKAIAKAGVVRKVDVRVRGKGRAYLSGIEVTDGATIQLGQGLHLLQVETDGAWKSSVVTVREGFVLEF